MRKFFVVTAIAISSQLHAQTDSLPKSSSVMDEVLLTASKYSVKTTETGKVVTVITRQEIEKAGSRDLAQVITEMGGVFINGYTNNAGKEKNIYLRGARVDYTLITIDGVPVYDASGIGSNFDIRNISIDNVERIEILKGSQSTLYGSDAIAGVINIITRKGGVKPFSLSGTAHYGTYNTLRASLSAGGHLSKLDYQVGYTHIGTDGFSEAKQPENSPVTFDKDDYNQNSLQANLQWQALEKLSIQPFFRASYFYGSLDQDAFSDASDFTNENRNRQIGVRNILSLGKARVNVLYQYLQTDRDYLDDSVQFSSFYAFDRRAYDAREHFAEAFMVYPVGPVKITAGMDLRQSSTDYRAVQKTIFSPGFLIDEQSGDSVRQKQVSGYAAVNYVKNSLSLEAGVRFNHHSEYGNNTAWNANASYTIKKNWKVFSNLSTGYKTPSLYQLFSFYGNRNLKPEISLNGESGIQYLGKKGNLRALYFRRTITDAIAFFTNTTTWTSMYVNQDEQNDHGFELDGNLELGRLNLKAIYSYVTGKITTMQDGKDTTYFNLLRRPKSSFTFSAGFKVTNDFFVQLQANSTGERKDVYFDMVSFEAKPVTLDPYVLVNLYAEYSFLKGKLKVFADARNLLNEEYYDVYGYNTAGFNAYGGIRFRL